MLSTDKSASEGMMNKQILCWCGWRTFHNHNKAKMNLTTCDQQIWRELWIWISNWHACILGLEPSWLGIPDGFSEAFIKHNEAFHDLSRLQKLHPLGNHSIRLLGSQQLSIMCFQLTVLIVISQLYRSSHNQLQALWVKLWLTVLWHLPLFFHENMCSQSS
jgi:hypothetical protein